MTQNNPDTIPQRGLEHPSRQGTSQFKGMHILQSDERLLALLSAPEQAVLLATGSYVERAKELGVPVGTLRSRLHRARTKLASLREQTNSTPH